MSQKLFFFFFYGKVLPTNDGFIMFITQGKASNPHDTLFFPSLTKKVVLSFQWEPVQYFNNKIICDLVEEKFKGIISILVRRHSAVYLCYRRFRQEFISKIN